jgi:sugar phosphate isomerase/epimerase
MRLSVTSWSFPACTLPECAAIARALGIGALDVGLLHRPALDRAAILSDPAGAAECVAGLGVDLPNYYHLFGADLEERNLALPGTVDANARDLAKVMTFADAAGIATVFVLPGVINPGQSRVQAQRVATESLRALADVAKDHQARLCFEPHVHSWVESPDRARALVEASGVGLALDHAHFACIGYRQDEIDPLAPHAVHVHLRQARMGALQTRTGHGTLNFPALFGALRDSGYTGALAIEYVHQDYMNTLFEDVLTETIAMRDIFDAWTGAD